VWGPVTNTTRFFSDVLLKYVFFDYAIASHGLEPNFYFWFFFNIPCLAKKSYSSEFQEKSPKG
jgi:hypothetical protein